MRPNLISMLRCADGCDRELTLDVKTEQGGEVLDGTLGCPACGASYAVREGIARMLPPALAAEMAVSEDEARKRSEMRARDEQVGDYDRMWYLNLFGMVEIPATLAHLGLRADHTLLEGGCGTGRMTPTFAGKCARLVSVDFSFESLRVCRRKLQAAGVVNADLVQADICHLPFRTEVFDRVVSCQVLEHVPSAVSRDAAVADLARVLREDGRLALSAYQYSLLMRLFGQKEGEHAGGIPFFRFTRRELRELLARHLDVTSMTGALVYHYIAGCVKPAGRKSTLGAQ